MPQYKEVKLYSGLTTILFDDTNGRHAYYRLEEDGKKTRLCGVTTFLNIIDKPALIPWAVKTTVEYIRKNLDQLQNDPSELLKSAREEANRQRDLAAEIGSAIHDWIEKHIKGENPEMPDDDKVLTGVNAFLEWVEQNNVEFLEAEKIIYSMKYGYTGKLDITAKINGKLYLLDIKTGNNIYAETKMQTAAYLLAEMEETGKDYAGRVILRISKETEDDHKERTKDKDKIQPYKIFEAIFLDEEESDLMKDFDGFIACMSLYRWKQNAEKVLNNLRK
jgi:hypothetical protein